MKLRILVFATMIILCLSSACYATYTTGSRLEPAKIIIQGENMNLSNTSFILNGKIMIPVTELFEKLGFYLSWNSSLNQLIIYDNNIFVKITQNSFDASVNGKQKTMTMPAFVYKGELMASADFLLQTFELEYEIINNSLYLNHIENKNDTTISNKGITYKKYIIDNDELSIFIPDTYTYNSLDTTFENGFSRIYVIPKENTDSPKKIDLTEDIKSVITNSTEYTIKSYQDKESNKISDYYIKDALSVIRFENVPSSIEKYIMSSVNYQNNLPNLKLEHYYEFESFANYNIDINTELYSNMLIKNTHYFSGTADADSLKIKVEKKPESFEYNIPVQNGSFSGNIFLPFGLGKHNVEISIIKDNQKEKTLIFSALNTDNNRKNNLIPTHYLNYDNPETYSLLHKIGHKGTNQKSTSKIIYTWILENYQLDKKIVGVRTLSELIDNVEHINPQESCILYSGMLRASGIPSRIATKHGEKKLWVEAYLNGEWKYMGMPQDLETGEPFHFYQKIQIQSAEYLEY